MNYMLYSAVPHTQLIGNLMTPNQEFYATALVILWGGLIVGIIIYQIMESRKKH